MAAIHGKQGSVYRVVGATATKILNTTNWTVNEIQETAESRVHEADWVERVGGLRDFNVSIEGNVAAATAGNAYLTRSIAPGTPAGTLPAGTMIIRLRNTASTSPVYQGEIVVTDFSMSSPADGLQTFSLTGAGNGALQYTPK